MTEAEALAHLRKGDIAGLEALVRLYGEKALKAAFLICHDYALAEDVVQSSFIQAYERIHQLDPARPFRPWFLRSVVNATLMKVTRSHEVPMKVADGSEEQADNSPTPEEIVQRAETREELWAALRALSPKQRSAIIMRYYLGLSDDEIAETVAAPAGTVRRRLHDARQRLRRILTT